MIEFFPDEDDDGFGVLTEIVRACEAPPGYVTNYEDCDDTNPAINPDSVDICGNEVDEDCDDWPKTCYTYDVQRLEDAHSSATLSDFESALSLSGCMMDLNDDGLQDLVLSVRRESGGAAPSDRDVRIFLSPLQASFDLDEPDLSITGSPDEYFGFGAFCDYDFTGDALPDLIISAPGMHGAAPYLLGSVYGFKAPLGPTDSGSISTSEADLTIRGKEPNTLFGWHVAGGGDVNADGYQDLLVSDPAAGSYETGAAYLFLGPIAGSVSAVDAAAVYHGSASTEFGRDALLDGDYDGDGYSDIVISQPTYGDERNCLLGKVSVFFGSRSPRQNSADGDVSIVSLVAYDRLGYSMATVRNHGEDYLALGAPSLRDRCDVALDDTGEERGTVYVFRPSSAGSLNVQEALLQMDGETSGDHFGAFLTSYPSHPSADGLFVSSSSYVSAEGGQVGASYLLTLDTSSILAAEVKFAGCAEAPRSNDALTQADLFSDDGTQAGLQLLQMYRSRAGDGESAYYAGFFDAPQHNTQEARSR